MTYNVFGGMLNHTQSINPDSLNKSSAIAEMGDHLATIYMGLSSMQLYTLPPKILLIQKHHTGSSPTGAPLAPPPGRRLKVAADCTERVDSLSVCR